MKNRMALITGGMGDLGTAICKELIDQGAKVIAADRLDHDSALLWQARQKKSGYHIDLAYMDVTDFDSCAAMEKDVVERFGPIDILVNAAGTIHDVTFRKMTAEDWYSVVHTDLDSVFNVTRQFINSMIERQYGRIISISSVNGQKGQFGQTNYSSAKSGIYGFTKSLALEVGKYGITVNAISPGYVESQMVSTIAEPIRDKIVEGIPIKRFASPEEIAWSIAFLASERSGYITGSNLAVNGGIHMY